eukprot:CAMPEP_0118922686 /NCGR_PEP_ID=MMETSP1169-20130426/1536_1 /TAXON_ID=36882 /ORGANISM="Pyramimonas obovata, Strain CCMP722" /LENGTH=61 /DNA_ID=CAMNT_0006863601 /DNA_START=39 /DNA_END=224 /DNA_ORIENTATION=-
MAGKTFAFLGLGALTFYSMYSIDKMFASMHDRREERRTAKELRDNAFKSREKMLAEPSSGQ